MMYFQKRGITQVALLMPIGPLGELGSSLARKHAPTYKITILGEEKFDVKAPDVTTQLAKLRTLNPQAIMAFTTGEPAALLARNMAQMGMNVATLTGSDKRFLVSVRNGWKGAFINVRKSFDKLLKLSGREQGSRQRC
jgi:ABC-type branched-subunit amino acid transport system substrate-binding protein